MNQPFSIPARRPQVPAFKVYLLSDDDMALTLQDAKRNNTNPKINFVTIDGVEKPYTRTVNLTEDVYKQFMKSGGLDGISGRTNKSEKIIHCLDMTKQCIDKPRIVSEKEYMSIRSNMDHVNELKFA